MNARIVYKMKNIPYPWDNARRAQGVKVWALCRVVVPEFGPSTGSDFEPIGLFNIDSEAERFMLHAFLTSGENGLLKFDQSELELVHQLAKLGNFR